MGEILATLQVAEPSRRDAAVDVVCLADSGSVDTVIQPSIARRLVLPVDREESLYTAREEEISGRVVFADVRILPYDWHARQRVFVPDEAYQESLVFDPRTGGLKRPDGLLGVGLLQAGGYVLDFKRHRVARSG